ncbi:unnamed protein product [Aphanomyces euteiches]|uniref:Uncharacterized protein n=1 Tax=Aphanomyces euteiches TaxID=100861 RepID=A0A6G0X5I8_9STRA|nr:hypothetical protein Ae201684_008409 [Aphanomyces euteiches]KAH9070581.1 hypothetical protein Ae201684P_002938 [Aphanomyces euteiches]KAH9152341.1 hypothetical protein AeRB84_005205 [Aphanomyces euteiches]
MRTWDYSLPTLTKTKRFMDRKPWVDASPFRQAFYQAYPLLKQVKLDNLALIGGSVLSLLTGVFTSKDLDFFVITNNDKLSPEDAAEFAHERVKAFITDLFNVMNAHNTELNDLETNTRKTNPDFRIRPNQLYNLDLFRVRRQLNVYTIELPQLNGISLPIQVILTPYESLAQLLQRIDIACTAIAFFEGDVWFSEMSKFAFENSCFVVDGTSRAPDHLHRIVKYFDRGFDIILTSFDMSKVHTRNFAFGEVEVIDMAALTVVATKIKGTNKIRVDHIKKPKVTRPLTEEDGPAGAFDEYGHVQDSSFKVYAGTIRHNNIICLLNDNPVGFIVDGEGSNFANAFRQWPYITDRMLLFSYETVKSNVYSEGALQLDMLFKYFPFLKPNDLVHRILGSYVATMQQDGRRAAAIFNSTYDEYVDQVLDELIAEQIEIGKKKILEMGKLPVKMVAVELRYQTSNCTPEEFFGTYFKRIETQQ